MSSASFTTRSGGNGGRRDGRQGCSVFRMRGLCSLLLLRDVALPVGVVLLMGPTREGAIAVRLRTAVRAEREEDATVDPNFEALVVNQSPITTTADQVGGNVGLEELHAVELSRLVQGEGGAVHLVALRRNIAQRE